MGLMAGTTKRRFTPSHRKGSSTNSTRSGRSLMDLDIEDPQHEYAGIASTSDCRKGKKKWGRMFGRKDHPDDESQRSYNRINFVDVVHGSSEDEEPEKPVLEGLSDIASGSYENDDTVTETVDLTETIDTVGDDTLPDDTPILYEAFDCFTPNVRNESLTNEFRQDENGEDTPFGLLRHHFLDNLSREELLGDTTAETDNENDETIAETIDTLNTLNTLKENPSNENILFYEALQCLASQTPYKFEDSDSTTHDELNYNYTDGSTITSPTEKKEQESDESNPNATVLQINDNYTDSSTIISLTEGKQQKSNESNPNAAVLPSKSSHRRSWFAPSRWLSRRTTACNNSRKQEDQQTSIECRDDEHRKENDELEHRRTSTKDEEEEEGIASEDDDDHETVDEVDDGLPDPGENLIQHYQKLVLDILEYRGAAYTAPGVAIKDDTVNATKGSNDDNNIKESIASAKAEELQNLDPIFASQSFSTEEDEIEEPLGGNDDDNALIFGPSRSIVDNEDAGDAHAESSVAGEEIPENDAEAATVVREIHHQHKTAPSDEVSQEEEIPFDEKDDDQTKRATRLLPPPTPEPLWVRNHDKRNELAWVRCAPRNRSRPRDFPIPRRPVARPSDATVEHQPSQPAAWFCNGWCNSCGDDFVL